MKVKAIAKYFGALRYNNDHSYSATRILSGMLKFGIKHVDTGQGSTVKR